MLLPPNRIFPQFIRIQACSSTAIGFFHSISVVLWKIILFPACKTIWPFAFHFRSSPVWITTPILSSKNNASIVSCFSLEKPIYSGAAMYFLSLTQRFFTSGPGKTLESSRIHPLTTASYPSSMIVSNTFAPNSGTLYIISPVTGAYWYHHAFSSLCSGSISKWTFTIPSFVLITFPLKDAPFNFVFPLFSRLNPSS